MCEFAIKFMKIPESKHEVLLKHLGDLPRFARFMVIAFSAKRKIVEVTQELSEKSHYLEWAIFRVY